MDFAPRQIILTRGGYERLPWLIKQLEGIMGGATPTPGRHPVAPTKPKTTTKIKSRPAPKEAAGSPCVAPTRQIADEASAPQPLPRVEVGALIADAVSMGKM
jgi:hypothetical protein